MCEDLDIRGYDSEPVPHTFWRQREPARHAAILLPGVGYTCDMPLLYYPARLLLALGADVLRVEYAYGRRPDFAALSDAEQGQRLFSDVTAACRAVLAGRSYEQVTLVGKSLGTLAMGHVLTAGVVPQHTRAVWLTPLLGHVRAAIAQWRGPSLFVIGTDDPFYDQAQLVEAQEVTGGESVVVDGADHGLEIAGDIVQSLAAMEQVIRALQHFLTPVGA